MRRTRAILELIRGARLPGVAVAAAASVLVVISLSCGGASPDHVARRGRPDSLEREAPTWVDAFAASGEGTVPSTPPRHVILVSLDTLRADHLGAWGYDRPTSPFLDALARNGVRFANVISHSPKTAPSHMSVFTGVDPSVHGTHFSYDTEPPTVYPARDDLELLSETIHRGEFLTGAWTGGGQVSRSAGFARGFDFFWEGLGQINGSVMGRIGKWFRRNADTSCFLFIHTYQIHDPYLPPSPYNEVFTSPSYDGWVIGDRDRLREEAGGETFGVLHPLFWRTTGKRPDPSRIGQEDLQQLVALYDGGIRYTDDVLQGFFHGLLADGLLDDTLVIVFSDHGEEFLEHGDVLHKRLYRETLHVPVILFWPAGLPRGMVVEEQVPLMDLGPTLLELMHLGVPATNGATSLLPLLQRPDGEHHRPVFSEAPWANPTVHQSLRDDHTTYYDHGRGQVELFATDRDPRELRNLAPARPALVSEFGNRLAAVLALRGTVSDIPSQQALELSEEEIERLRALGYIP